MGICNLCVCVFSPSLSLKKKKERKIQHHARQGKAGSVIDPQSPHPQPALQTKLTPPPPAVILSLQSLLKETSSISDSQADQDLLLTFLCSKYVCLFAHPHPLPFHLLNQSVKKLILQCVLRAKARENNYTHQGICKEIHAHMPLQRNLQYEGNIKR